MIRSTGFPASFRSTGLRWIASAHTQGHLNVATANDDDYLYGWNEQIG